MTTAECTQTLNMNDDVTIRSIAVKILESKLKHEKSEESLAYALFVLGSKSSGKSTAINVFLDKDDIPKETLGLEYGYGRKNVHGHLTEKNICHVWELGGDMFQTANIVNIPFSAHKNCRMTVIIFLDLSQPKKLWSTLEYCHETIRKSIEINERKDVSFLLIGGKYDLYSELDSASKKLVCKTLRGVALLLSATLIFFSRTDANCKKRLRDYLCSLAFGTEQKMKGAVLDANKPLFVPIGGDSWESINGSSSSAATTWDALKSQYVSQFPQVRSSQTIVPEDPSLEAIYREPIIDQLRNEKDEELKALMSVAFRNNL